ncbi:ALP1-like protein isoform X1 [Tanacetum coccineum]|uniref:ALP1-like protein isoform X1 n=1 Tax=Tanacetum coccineum TaxID=301880 RepID=A0ABQ5EG90_9ASTR
MDPNNLNDFDTTNTYDHYDAFFQPDYDRYMRDYESYQHYMSLCEQEAGGSSSGPIRRRRYIYREREEAEERLIDDYFGDDEYEPKYPKETFRRRYRMSSTLFNKILNDILSYDVQPIPEYFTYLSSRLDATGQWIVIVNGHTYMKGYYLADGIYPEWSTFVKTFSVTRDAKTFKFKTVQEAARKDIERAFGVLQGRWGYYTTTRYACNANQQPQDIMVILYNILHNMILENEGFEVNLNHMFVSPEPNMVRSWVERCDLHVRKAKELRDRKTHIDLRQDLVEHLWNNQ